jgi:competence protein ComEC
MPVRKVITNGQSSATSTYEKFLDAIISAKAEYGEVKRGDRFSVDSLTFEVLNPTSSPAGDVNANSLVLRVVYSTTTFLFTGDADQGAEAGMLGSGLALNAAILKVAHHGSRTSSSAAFLAAVSPETAIYFAGRGNQFGLPDEDVLAALAAAGVEGTPDMVEGWFSRNHEGLRNRY